MEINFSCATLSNGIHWSIRVTCIFKGVVYFEKIQATVEILRGIPRVHKYFISCLRKNKWSRQSVRHMRGAPWEGCNTIEYSTALYFLWHGINRDILTKLQRENLILNFLFSVFFFFCFVLFLQYLF